LGARVRLGPSTDSTLFPILQAQVGFRFEVRIAGDERFDSSLIVSRLRELGLVFEIHGEPVRAARVPLLRGDADAIAGVNGHLCSVGWRPNSEQLVGNLSLFNELAYEVVLCRQPLGIADSYFRGHLFDLASRQIIELPIAIDEPANSRTSEPPNPRTI